MLLLTLAASVLLFCPSATAQESATVDAPLAVKAGEHIKFTVNLNPAPSFEGGSVSFTIVGPDWNVQTSIGCVSGQAECQAAIQIPATASGGTYHIHINGFDTGTKSIPLKVSEVTFEVIGNKNLVFPSTAVVMLNPSQVQLLRTAAIHLQAQIQNFKASLAGLNSKKFVIETIRHNISQALGSLEATQNSLRALGLTGTQGEEQRVFFKDLRAAYEDVLNGLDKRAPMTGNSSVYLPVSAVEADQPKVGDWTYPIEAQGALRAFEQNELAYRIVAETQSLVFDLTVNSVPAGAELCFYRRGDTCRQHPDPTNTVIRSLPYALWIVRFQKQGYRSEEREHDPFREPNHVLNVELGK